MIANIFKILVISITLSSCGATGPYFTKLDQISNDKALVYLYRSDITQGSRNAVPSILFNKKPIVELKNNGYTPISVTPGTYTIETDWGWTARIGNSKIVDKFEAGKKYFYHFGLENKGLSSLTLLGSAGAYAEHDIISKFTKRNEKEAMSELKKYRLVEPLKEHNK